MYIEKFIEKKKKNGKKWKIRRIFYMYYKLYMSLSWQYRDGENFAEALWDDDDDAYVSEWVLRVPRCCFFSLVWREKRISKTI